MDSAALPVAGDPTADGEFSSGLLLRPTEPGLIDLSGEQNSRFTY
jgi:hypothetical protein